MEIRSFITLIYYTEIRKIGKDIRIAEIRSFITLIPDRSVQDPSHQTRVLGQVQRGGKGLFCTDIFERQSLATKCRDVSSVSKLTHLIIKDYK